MAGFLVRVLVNILALYVASILVPNFIVVGGLREFVLAGLALAALNMLVRPVIKFVSLPLIILTLGLFTVFINALMLWLVDLSFVFVAIQTFGALFWATLVVSAVNVLSDHT